MSNEIITVIRKVIFFFYHRSPWSSWLHMLWTKYACSNIFWYGHVENRRHIGGLQDFLSKQIRLISWLEINMYTNAKWWHHHWFMNCTIVGKLSLRQYMTLLLWFYLHTCIESDSYASSLLPLSIDQFAKVMWYFDFNDVSSIFHKTIQKWLRNLMSW